VPNVTKFKREVIKKAHNSTFITHLGNTKMHNDMKTHFECLGMKRDMSDFLSKCLTSHKVKTKNQKPNILV